MKKLPHQTLCVADLRQSFVYAKSVAYTRKMPFIIPDYLSLIPLINQRISIPPDPYHRPKRLRASSTNSPPYTSSSSPPPRNPPCRNPREGYPESASTNPPESRNASIPPSAVGILSARSARRFGRGSCHLTVCTPRCQRKAPRNPHSQAFRRASGEESRRRSEESSVSRLRRIIFIPDTLPEDFARRISRGRRG